jgi:hypothetical protein
MWKGIEFVSGYIVSTSGAALDRRSLVSAHVGFVGNAPTQSWEWFEYKSSESLADEDKAGIKGPYTYPLLCRRSGPRLLLLSLNREIVIHLLDHEYDAFSNLPLFRLSIAIHDLVRVLVRTPERYVLSFVHARIPAFGSSLRAASFYGDDIGNSKIFRDNLELLNCHTCGLRDVVQGDEIVRLRSDGGISVSSLTSSKLGQAEAALSFVSRNGLIRNTGVDLSSVRW